MNTESRPCPCWQRRVVVQKEHGDNYILFTNLRKNVIYYNQKAEGVEKADAMEAFVDDPTVDL